MWVVFADAATDQFGCVDVPDENLQSYAHLVDQPSDLSGASLDRFRRATVLFRSLDPS